MSIKINDRENYHITELGLLPEGWKVSILGEILKVGYGKNQKDVEISKSNIPILGTGGIIGWASKALFDKPSVLIGRKGTINKPQFMEKPFWTIDTLFYTDIDTKLAWPKFVYYLFQSIDWYKYNEATGVPSLSATNIANIKQPLPPLNQQQKIAEILSIVDKQIEETDQLIVKTTELKKGLLQKLMTKGIGHTNFQETDIGKIPVTWEVGTLHELVDKVTDGAHKTPKYTTDGIPFLRVTDIQKKDIDWNNTKYISVEEHLELKKRCNPDKGDILLSKNGTIGLVKYINWDREFSIFVSLCLIKTKKNCTFLIPEFLTYFISSEVAQKQFKNSSKQGTVTNLHLVEIKQLMVPLPSIKEQQKIVQIISSVDDQIEIFEQERQKYRELKQGLMQQLLTGKLRVRV